MHAFEKIVESRIREAMDRGEFDNLPGAGKELILEQDPFVPEDMRMAYKILKNAGYIPPEIELRNDIAGIECSLEDEADRENCRKTLKKLQCLFIRLDESRHRHTSLLLQQDYYQKVMKQLAGA